MMNAKVVAAFLSLIFVVMVLGCGCTSVEKTTSADSASEEEPVEGVTPVEERSYIVGIDGQYPPFSMMDTNGEATGFDVESMRWIAKDQGMDVKFEAIAWDGIIPALNAGKIDLVYAGMTITDERKEKINFSNPYWTVNQSVVIRDDSNITFEEVQAGKAVLGSQRGTTGAYWVEDNLITPGLMPRDNLKLYESAPIAIDDLSSGRIDAVVFDSTTINDIIEGKPMHVIGAFETNEVFGIAVRKDDTALLDKLNTGLSNLMASEDWKALQEKYKVA